MAAPLSAPAPKPPEKKKEDPHRVSKNCFSIMVKSKCLANFFFFWWKMSVKILSCICGCKREAFLNSVKIPDWFPKDKQEKCQDLIHEIRASYRLR
ncbi:MAG: hypothetical protein MRY21_04480 [Simkaniaceae bacterium]|nr:hypothetical protein [Simkaniaceae bacterium]